MGHNMFTHARSSRAGKNRFALLITVVATFFAMLFVGAPASSAAPVSDTEKSIVLVGITWTGYVYYPTDAAFTQWKWSDQTTASSFCTGWFASTTGHIVTAGHCVDPQGGREAIIQNFLTANNATKFLDVAILNWRVAGDSSGAPPVRSVQVVQPDGVKDTVIDEPLRAEVVNLKPFDQGDVALLRVAELSDPTVPLAIATTKPEIGSNLTAIGFPSSVVKVTDGRRIRPSFKTGTVSSHQVNNNGISGTEINAELGSGMSGGPTVNDQGQVIGVNSYKAIGNAEANFNFITDTENLRSFLQANNVAFNAVSAQPAATANPPGGPVLPGETIPVKSAGDGFSVWPLIIGVLVVGGLVGGFFFLRSKKMLPAFANGSAPVANHAPGMQSPMAMQQHAQPPLPGAPVHYMPQQDLPVAMQQPQPQPDIYCRDDSHEHPPQAKFCAECGKPVPSLT
jgi:hypothetical protein